MASKLERYRQAGIADVVLCVDRAMGPALDGDAQVCSFVRRVEVDDLLDR